MKNTLVILPVRLAAERFNRKPLASINNMPMIIHSLKRALEAKVGEVFVATPDIEILDIVKKHGGQAILTTNNHPNGTSRVFEAFTKLKNNDVDLVFNLQGDMPTIKPSSISKLEKLMRQNNCDIGTLASPIKNKDEIVDTNIVKVHVDEDLKNDNFLDAKDFFRTKTNLKNEKIYHHIGIYAFTSIALSKYVKLSRSKLEIERNLEQMRAMENNMSIKVGLSNSTPLGVDTEADLKKVSEEMN